jgi:hypothetical protein
MSVKVFFTIMFKLERDLCGKEAVSSDKAGNVSNLNCQRPDFKCLAALVSLLSSYQLCVRETESQCRVVEDLEHHGAAARSRPDDGIPEKMNSIASHCRIRAR